MTPTPSVNVTDSFWKSYFRIVKDVMLPFQWDIIHDEANITIESERDDAAIPTEKSHVIENFRIAAGQKKGNHYGWLFQDSDLYKWIEAAANTYQIEADPALLGMMEECVQLIEDAQDEDGYLSTFYQIEAPQLKFRRLFQSHELYCAGHLIEAAIAYEIATGSHQLLAVAERFIDCIKEHFGPEPGKINGSDGHQEIELALVRLYEHTGERKYLDLSYFFLDVRGQDPDFYQKQLQENIDKGLEKGPVAPVNLVYHQAHKPVVEQNEAQGHAVRLVYMAQAMAGTGNYLEDDALIQAAEKIWQNIVHKRMYITGGIGSTVRGEAFTFDYDLPNDLMYCETCAAIGLLNFTEVLQKRDQKVAHADVMERVLYNSMISGMSLDGKHFFYVNPLEVDPEASLKNPDKSHVKASRPSWFGCACCPPNLARTIPAIHRYIYQADSETNQLWLNQWIASEWSNDSIHLSQTHDFDNKKESRFTIKNDKSEEYIINIRIPYWVEEVEMLIDGQKEKVTLTNGYLELQAAPGETRIDLTYQMPVLKWQAHPKVKSSYGKLSFQRGPFIYTAEEADNGKNLHLLHVNGETEAIVVENNYLELPAKRLVDDQQESLYQLFERKTYEDVKLTLIPYYLWANREIGEMRVWLQEGG